MESKYLKFDETLLRKIPKAGPSMRPTEAGASGSRLVGGAPIFNPSTCLCCSSIHSLDWKRRRRRVRKEMSVKGR